MFSRRTATAALAVTLVLAACSDQPQEASIDPQFKPGTVSPTACDFNSLQGFIVGYFPGSQQSGIFSLRDAMAAAATPSARQEIGFQIMDSIGKTSRTVSLSSSALTAGSNLTKGLIKCMFDASNTAEFPGFPDSPQYDFHLALNAPAGGAYYVRRSNQENSTPVLSVQSTFAGSNTLSGVAPPPGSTWSNVLNETVLFYGYHLASASEFEWATIRPNAVFDTEAIIALCVGAVPENTLVHESNIGFLAWQGTGDYICGVTTPALTRLESGWGTRALARRLERWGRAALLPQPAFAAVTLTSGGTGSAKTLRSRFRLDPVSGAIVLTLDIPPSAVEKKNQEFIVRVRATIDGKGANGQCIVAQGFNNNGGPAELNGPSNCDAPGPKELAKLTETVFLGPQNGNPEAGYATFNITIPSPGAMTLAFSVFEQGDDNLSLPFTGTSTRKFTVKP